MDRVNKLIRKLSEKERVKVIRAIELILVGDIARLDVKKLKGEKNIFRVRVRDLRIIFAYEKNLPRIISVDRRNDTTYR